jgi:hypothetical protein
MVIHFVMPLNYHKGICSVGCAMSRKWQETISSCALVWFHRKQALDLKLTAEFCYSKSIYHVLVN